MTVVSESTTLDTVQKCLSRLFSVSRRKAIRIFEALPWMISDDKRERKRPLSVF